MQSFFRFVTISAALVGLVAAAMFASAPAHAEEPAQEPAASFEVEFMTMMIDHHNMANEMAAICQEKAVNADLKAMCDEVIAAQSQEIEDMQSWLDAWYDETHEPMMMPEDEAMLAELEALTGGPFEVRFMQMMTEHHMTAMTRAEECQTEAEHQDLLDMCANIIETQQAEIDQMATWLCDRYGECGTTPTVVATQQPAANATPTAPSGVVAPVAAPNTGSGPGGGDGGSFAMLTFAAALLGIAALTVAVSTKRRA